MNECPIAKIEVDPSGRLLVRPHGERNTIYEYVYREANGLRWDKEKQSICAYEPSRWDHEELLRHVAATLVDAFGEQLRITERTAWVGVPQDLQRRLCQALSRGQAS